MLKKLLFYLLCFLIPPNIANAYTVGYDPANMSTGRPFYDYSVVSDQTPFYHLKEADLWKEGE